MLPKVFFALVLLFYLLFPNQTHSVDAWAYAGQVKYGTELFSPHHLLNSFSAYRLYTFVQFVGLQVDAMQFMLLLNGVLAWLCVIILYRILLLQGSKNALLWSLIAAFSFGQWRFATENETYIFPLFFSLLATFFYLKQLVPTLRDFFRPSYMQIMLSGFFASLACLYHQAHIFWWLCLLAGIVFLSERKQLHKYLIFYTLPFIIVPLAYIIVLKNAFHEAIILENLWHFVLQDVYSGAAGKPIGAQHFILGFINFFRSFFQFHGNIFLLIKNSWLYVIPIFITIIFVAAAIYFIWKKRPKLYMQLRKNPEWSEQVALVFGGIFLLQYSFAVYNVGNAEFMVMLPALAVLVLSCFQFDKKVLILICAALFVWNFFLGVYPNHTNKYAADEEVAKFIMQNKSVPFMAEESALAGNIIYYKTGKNPQNIWQSPAKYKEKFGGTDLLKMRTDSFLSSNSYFYTDCTGRPQMLNRAAMMNGNTDAVFMNFYRCEAIKSYETVAGKHIIYKVSAKNAFYR